MYTEDELKKIKISIRRKVPTSVDSTNEEILDYSFSNEEKLPIHIRPLEGTKPLFDTKIANRINTPSPKRVPSRLSSRRHSQPSREFETNPVLEIVSNQLEDLLDEVKEKTRDAERDARNARKRSQSSSYSSRSRSNSLSPRRKRMRRDSECSNRHKYGHSSRSNVHNENEREREIGNERKCRYRDRSRSSSSNRSFSSYLSRKLKRDMSSLLNDSICSHHSRRSDRKNSKTHYRKYSRKSDRNEENYDHDYYGHDSYYHDMKERYARYYSVMYAFNIIMDILRKDDLYNNHY